MKKTFLALALAAGLTSFAGSAKASIDFSQYETITDSYNPSKSVTLEIILNNSETAATSIRTISSTGGIHIFNGNFATLNPYYNSFEVRNGAIISQNFEVSYDDGSNVQYSFGANLSLKNTDIKDYYGYTTPALQYSTYEYKYYFPPDVGYVYNDTISQSITAAVPEPSQVAASLLLAAGIAGFVIIRRKQASAA